MSDETPKMPDQDVAGETKTPASDALASDANAETAAGARRREPRFRRVPMRLILPNMVTLMALCSGLTAIRMAFEGRWEFAVGAILVAAVLDALDGRLARMLKGTSRFGAELDSLADFVNFGVTPALMLYVWILNEAGSFGWIAALLFAISSALRLARFNVALDDPNKPEWAVHFFTGVPAPAGALTVLMPIYWEFLGILPHWPEFAPLVAFYTILIAFLMVSRLPTFSGKKFGARIRRDLVLPLFVCAVLVVALIVSYPFRMLTLGSALYLLSIPLAWRAYRKYLKGHVVDDYDDDGDCEDTDLDHLGDVTKSDTA